MSSLNEYWDSFSCEVQCEEEYMVYENDMEFNEEEMEDVFQEISECIRQIKAVLDEQVRCIHEIESNFRNQGD